jgi:hypothetical protein
MKSYIDDDNEKMEIPGPPVFSSSNATTATILLAMVAHFELECDFQQPLDNTGCQFPGKYEQYLPRSSPNTIILLTWGVLLVPQQTDRQCPTPRVCQ